MGIYPREVGNTSCDNGLMAENDRIARIAGLLEEHKLPMKTVSLAAGLNETFVRDLLKRGRSPLAENLDAVEAAIARLANRVPLEPLTPEIRKADKPPLYRGTLPKDVPMMGTAAGSPLKKGAFRFSAEPVDIVVRPPGLLDAADVYSLYVEGDSMSPKYEPGDLIYVNPHRPARPGDTVVIQDPTADGDEFEGYVKILVRRSGGEVITRQLNPEGELKFKQTPGLKVHRVYTVAELFGL